MPLPLKKTYHIDDIYNLPNGCRAELIDGQIYDMAPPGTMHQRLVSRLNTVINNYIEMNHGSCEVFPAPFAVFLNNDELNYFEPDLSVICAPDKLDAKGCHGAPDWIIEIISPSTSSYDYVLKLNKYMSAGVREYWIVNPMPQSKSITVYFFEADIFAKTYTFAERVKVNIYEDFYIDFSRFT